MQAYLLYLLNHLQEINTADIVQLERHPRKFMAYETQHNTTSYTPSTVTPSVNLFWIKLMVYAVIFLYFL